MFVVKMVTNRTPSLDRLVYASIHSGWPIRPLAVLNKLIGEFPSVNMMLVKPRPCNNLACISGPACAIDCIVSRPMESTWLRNF
jgi:hypothetical protein